MRLPRRRLASITTATIIVVAAIGGGLAPNPVQPAKAEELFPDCSWYASTHLGYTEMMLNTVSGADTGCRVNLDLGEDSTAQADVYAGAVTIDEAQQTALASIDNRLVDARGPAYTEAKIAMVNELNAGGNETEVRRAAHDAIDDFYSPMYANVNSLWIQKVTYYNYSWSANAQNGVGTDEIWIEGEAMPLEPSDDPVTDWYRVNLSDRELTLPNGSTVPTKAIHGIPTASQPDGQPLDVHWSDNESLSGDLPTKFPSGASNHVSFLMYPEPYAEHVFLEVPAEGSETWRYDEQAGQSPAPDLSGVREPSDTHHYYHTKIYAEIDQVKANIDPLVNDTVANYSAGELDTTEVLSPVELASRASTDYNSTGYYAFHAAQLAMMGYAGNLTHSHVVDYNGSLYNGTLFYTGDDLDGLETGETYDPSTFEGDFAMAYQVDANQSAIIDLEDNFTIVEQTDTRTGEAVTNTTIEEYTYTTTNASDLAEELERLSDAREEMADQGLTIDVGGGGFLDGISSFFGNLLGGSSVGVLLIGTAVVVFLLGRGS